MMALREVERRERVSRSWRIVAVSVTSYIDCKQGFLQAVVRNEGR